MSKVNQTNTFPETNESYFEYSYGLLINNIIYLFICFYLLFSFFTSLSQIFAIKAINIANHLEV